MSPLTVTVKLGERLERLEKTAGNTAILYALQLSPCNPEAAFYTVPHLQHSMVFHDSSS